MSEYKKAVKKDAEEYGLTIEQLMWLDEQLVPRETYWDIFKVRYNYKVNYEEKRTD